MLDVMPVRLFILQMGKKKGMEASFPEERINS